MPGLVGLQFMLARGDKCLGWGVCSSCWPRGDRLSSWASPWRRWVACARGVCCLKSLRPSPGHRAQTGSRGRQAGLRWWAGSGSVGKALSRSCSGLGWGTAAQEPLVFPRGMVPTPPRACQTLTLQGSPSRGDRRGPSSSESQSHGSCSQSRVLCTIRFPRVPHDSSDSPGLSSFAFPEEDRDDDSER